MKKLKISKCSVAKVIALSFILLGTFFVGAILTVPIAHQEGYKEGYIQALDDIEQRTGFKFEWIDLGNGRYQIIVYYENKLITALGYELHCEVIHIRNGKVLSVTNHPMTLTTFGKDWIVDNLANSGGANVTKFANYIGVSNDSTEFSAAWTALPNEITDGGLERALGTFTDTGTGTWNMSKTFSVSETRSTKLYGVYIDSYANWVNGGLIAAEQQGIASQKNLISGDSLKVTIQGTGS